MPLEMHKQHTQLLESEIQELQLQLHKAREDIYGLVRMHAELSIERDKLRTGLKASDNALASCKTDLSFVMRTDDVEGDYLLVPQGPTLPAKISGFQFRDIRPKAASEIVDIGHASLLLGHSNQQITKRVYRSLGATAVP